MDALVVSRKPALSVLVVDDELCARKALRVSLSGFGYTVAEAANGREAERLMRTWRPDAIVADVAMPEMDGVELVRHVRADVRLREVPFIAVSAYASVDDSVAILEAGADDFVAKPFVTRDLAARVLARLEHQHDSSAPMIVADVAPEALSAPLRTHVPWSWLLVGLVVSATVVAIAALALRLAGVSGVTFVCLAAAVATLSFRTDAFAGLVAGLGGGAGIVALHADAPVGHGDFALLTGAIATLVALGGSLGGLGDARRRRQCQQVDHARRSSALSAAGSLGMFSAVAGALRLDEERSRAILHRRPLTLAHITVDVLDGALSDSDGSRLVRAVARIVEAELHATDIPYADGPTDFHVIMPETDLAAARAILAPKLEHALSATFAARDASRRWRVGDLAMISLSLNDGTAEPAPVGNSALPAADPPELR